jgi:hypothetical protein
MTTEAAVVPSLDWRAIASGAAASLAVSLSVGLLASRYVLAHPPGEGGATRLLYLALPLVGLVADALGGALAGLMAKRRGMVHGLLAALLASAGGLVVSISRLALHGALAPLLAPVFWLQMVLWIALGAFVAMAAGALAAGMTRAASRG